MEQKTEAKKSQAIVKPQPTALDLLRRYHGEFLKVIPRHMNPERMLRIAEGVIKRDQKLLACTAGSILRSVLEASILGLEIGVLGEGYLIPYKKDCTFQPGYMGLIKLAIQSKSVMAVQVGAVRKGDDFDYELGSQPFVKHKPSLSSDPEERPYAVYCVLQLPSGAFQATIMSESDVERIRRFSMAKGDGPWVAHWEMMAIKTAIKRALKYVPKTPELARTIEADDRRDAGEAAGDLFPEIPEKLPGEDAKDVTPPKDTATEAAEKLGVSAQNEGQKSLHPDDEWGLNEEAARVLREAKESTDGE